MKNLIKIGTLAIFLANIGNASTKYSSKISIVEGLPEAVKPKITDELTAYNPITMQDTTNRATIHNIKPNPSGVSINYFEEFGMGHFFGNEKINGEEFGKFQRGEINMVSEPNTSLVIYAVAGNTGSWMQGTIINQSEKTDLIFANPNGYKFFGHTKNFDNVTFAKSEISFAPDDKINLGELNKTSDKSSTYIRKSVMSDTHAIHSIDFGDEQNARYFNRIQYVYLKDNGELYYKTVDG